MKTIKIMISGTVQGIFFRKFIKQEADKLDIKGFVRNLDNGKVEVIAEGRDETVNQFFEITKKGNPHSQIKDTEVEEITHVGFDSFKILTI